MKNVRCVDLLNVPYDTVTVTRTPWPFVNGVCVEVSDEDAAQFAKLPGFVVGEIAESWATSDQPQAKASMDDLLGIVLPADEPTVPDVVPVTTPVQSRRQRRNS